MRTIMARWSSTLALLLAACCPALATNGTLSGSGNWAAYGATGTFSLNVQQSGLSISGTFQFAGSDSTGAWSTQMNITSGDIAGVMSGPQQTQYWYPNGSPAGTGFGTWTLSYSTTGGDYDHGWIQIGNYRYQITSGGIVLTVVPSYSVSLLYDSSRSVKSGAAYPIKLQVYNASGVNVSSSSLAVTAQGIVKRDSAPDGALQETGNANPSFGFRYDASLGGYIYNVSTGGLSPGTYVVQFTVGNTSTVYEAPFNVR
jgi:hypothetical protein